MAFVVKKINLDDLDNKTGSYTYKGKDVDGADTSINITFKSFNNPQFQKAYGMIASRDKSDADAIKVKKLDDNFLDGLNEGDKTTGDIMVRAVGKFLIADWDVADESGDKLPINADNFVLLLANLPIDEQMGFFQWCMDSAGDVAVNSAKALAETKKKRSTATSGKKTSQA